MHIKIIHNIKVHTTFKIVIIIIRYTLVYKLRQNIDDDDAQLGVRQVAAFSVLAALHAQLCSRRLRAWKHTCL